MDALIPPAVSAELLRSLFAFLKVSGMVLLIVTPIITVMELLRIYHWLDRLLTPLHHLFYWMRIRKESVVALVVGLIFGIAYGGGVMMEEKNSGALNKRDALLIGVFLSLCHALIEDTLIFAAIGADLLIILFVRTGFAVLVILILSRLLPRGPKIS
ncbi:MAG: nucleoside recognition protein [Thermodesulfobacteriota bacterium]